MHKLPKTAGWIHLVDEGRASFEAGATGGIKKEHPPRGCSKIP